MARVTVEDCLVNIPNRFALSMITTLRTKQLLKGAHPLLQTKNKFVVVALREIAEGKVSIKERKSGK